jgi:phosphoribosyl 1,2-cyclic phosphodiesterase
MGSKNEIIILGSGGGRFTAITQLRATGGLRLHLDGRKMHIDPGPGALLRSIRAKCSPSEIDALFISHTHIDHLADIYVMIEAMTSGLLAQKGCLIGNRTAMQGDGKTQPRILEYYQKAIKNTGTLKPGDSCKIDNIVVEATKSRHNELNTIGFKFYYSGGVISFVGDTEYFEELSEQHKDSEIVILNILKPKNYKHPGHMCTVDAIRLVSELKPRLLIIQHFGITMIKSNPVVSARQIQRATGVKTLAARDNMRIKLSRKYG